MEVTTAAILQGLVRKEGRSLLQYVGESFPWTTAKNHHALPVLQGLIDEEQKATAGIVQYLVKNRVRPPYLGAYPMSFTTINYMSLDFLLPLLKDFEKRRIAELEKSQILVIEEEPKQLLHALIDMKKRHLAALAAL